MLISFYTISYLQKANRACLPVTRQVVYIAQKLVSPGEQLGSSSLFIGEGESVLLIVVFFCVMDFMLCLPISLDFQVLLVPSVFSSDYVLANLLCKRLFQKRNPHLIVICSRMCAHNTLSMDYRKEVVYIYIIPDTKSPEPTVEYPIIILSSYLVAILWYNL